MYFICAFLTQLMFNYYLKQVEIANVNSMQSALLGFFGFDLICDLGF